MINVWTTSHVNVPNSVIPLCICMHIANTFKLWIVKIFKILFIRYRGNQSKHAWIWLKNYVVLPAGPRPQGRVGGGNSFPGPGGLGAYSTGYNSQAAHWHALGSWVCGFAVRLGHCTGEDELWPVDSCPEEKWLLRDILGKGHRMCRWGMNLEGFSMTC